MKIYIEILIEIEIEIEIEIGSRIGIEIEIEIEKGIEQAQLELAKLNNISDRHEVVAKLRTELSEARAGATERQSFYDRLIGEADSRSQRLADMR